MARKGSVPNKSNQIYCTVREDIVSGKYPGGTFLTENELCEQFSVSRTPVREALIRLSQDRFVDLIPNRGAVVPHVTITDIIDVLQIRTVNEGLAAALIANSHTATVLKKLEDSVAREERLLAAEPVDALIVSREDFVFHHLLASFCGNTRLADVLELIDNQMHRFARISADQMAVETLSISVGFHRRALEAIRNGDADQARHIIEEHWMAMREGYVQRSLSGHLSLQL